MLLRVFTFLATSVSVFAIRSNTTSCRVLPGDADWPGTDEWAKLNTTVNGRLIATIPDGYVCHEPTYDADACATLAQTWNLPQSHFNSPSGFIAALYQNASCDPFTPSSSPCLQGNYVSYAINVSSAQDVSAGVRFAQEKNVRLVIKNTGHDYLGKSTGKGALSIWTHNLKTIDFLDYNSSTYSGKAIKMGAGVQAFEAYEAASAHGLKIVGGECITVGLAGGYTQGGGHSLISSVYGMGADQALEWEVVTAEGELVKASPTQSSDLYWALSGGGGGTYGVVLSLTAKIYPDGVVGGASLVFLGTADILFDALTVWHTVYANIVKAGAHVTWVVYPIVYIWEISELTIPGATEDDIRVLLQPFTSYLDQRNVSYQLNVTSFPTYIQHIDRYVGPLPYGNTPTAQIQGGVLISSDSVQQNNADIVSVLRNITDSGNWFIGGYALGPTQKPAVPNAVLPAWRDVVIIYQAIGFWNYSVPVEQMDAQETLLTNTLMPPLQKSASGAYMNEADSNDPLWKTAFFGENYDKLLNIKKKWDSNDLFYAKTAVGSDAWTVAGDGRLCKA